MKVCVYGLGQIGLPTAALLAGDHDVVGVDTDPSVVEAVRNGESPLDEPGVERLLSTVDLRVTDEPEPADFHLLAVPTPLDRTTGVADLGAVQAATAAVADVATDGSTVVLESTVPPGTLDRLVAPLLPDEVGVAYCPERAIPGDTLAELRSNDRLVGCHDPETADRVVALYETFADGAIRRTTPTTAEFVKLMENTYRDVNIALANEFALLSEALGVDVHEARTLANQHPRVDVLRPGPGVGGHCITVDPWFLTGSEATTRLVPTAREVNDTMPDHVLQLVRRAVDGTPGAKVGVLGVAYKGNVADTRETPARRVCQRLANDGYEVVVADPLVESFEWPLREIETAATDADCLVVVTDHDVFRELDPARLASLMATSRVVDTRNLLDHDAWRTAGFEVTVLGDGRSSPSG